MKSEKITKALKSINDKYGANTIMSFNKKSILNVERFPSGSIALDLILGGGWPKGRIIELFGPESSGKTTLALHAIAEIHKQGGIAAFLDLEHSFDPIYAQNIGVEVDNEDKFLFSQPDSGDDASEIIRTLIGTGEVRLIVVDSVSAMTPISELEGEISEAKMGVLARLMGKLMRLINGPASKNQTSIMFINQLRDKIGIVYGNPETTTGGNALKFFSSVRCDIRRIAFNKDGENTVSIKVKVKNVKNKTAPAHGMCEFNIVFGKGIDSITEIIEEAAEAGIILKKGSWYSYGDTKLGQGLASVINILEDNPELLEEITLKLKK